MPYKLSKKIILVLLLACAFGLIFYFGKYRLSLPIINFFTPVIKTYDKVSSSVLLSLNIFKPKSNIVAENKVLKQRISELETEILNKEVLIGELSSSSQNSSEIVGTRVSSPISFSPRTPYDTLIIDIGSEDGVVAGAKAFISDRIQIGVVETVYPNKSIVRLYSSSGIKTEAVLLRTGEVVELEGSGGGNFKLNLPTDFDIKEGDMFVSLGTHKSLLAETRSINEDENSSLVSVILALPIKINGNSKIYVEI